MKSKLIVLSVFLNFLFVLAACNGVHIASAPSAPGLHAFVGAVPGFHGLSAKQTTAFDFSIVPKLQAQSTNTVSFSGSYSGFCASIPAPPSAGTWAVALYGSGSLVPDDCGTFTTDTDAGLAAADSAHGGQLVIGDGTLGPFVAWADNSSAIVRVFVNRGGQIIDAQIPITLTGASTRVTNPSTFSVLDGDLIIVTAQGSAPSTNLQFVLAKQ